MKTPLQSHIMAIIVRDGGRPPERRWQLFTRFYEIILRREANRQLPDERLARILREEDQLVKSVHNRLGFDLHARAETSEGAQTQLSRGEFRDLVEQAVVQRADDAEADLVDVVVEATQERLVLVSTPDDGDHVRFDVRQLQEFFAAEFIYDSIDADALRSRLELIAGDQHWREVMHFLISALIENARRTELAVVVQVLGAVDGSASERAERILRRRLAIGASSVARLIQEGVLEQDKRYRQDVRPVVGVLGGISDLVVLQAVMDTNHPQSRLWLIRLALEMIQEGAEEESAGWLALLGGLVLDRDPMVGTVAEVVRSVSSPRFSTMLDCLSAFFDPEGEATADHSDRTWIVRETIRRLTSPEWHELQPRGVRVAREFLNQDLDTLLSTAAELGFSDISREILVECVMYHWRTDTDTVHHGAVTLHHYANDWSTGTTHRPELSDSALVSAELSGMLSIVRHLLLFARRSDCPSANALIAELESAPWVIEVLDGQYAAYFPSLREGSISTLVAHLKDLSWNETQDLLDQGSDHVFTLERRIYGRRYITPETKNDFLRMINDHPDSALRLHSSWGAYIHDEPQPDWLRDPEISRALGEAILADGMISDDLFGPVGSLVGELPELALPLRRLIKAKFTGTPGSTYWVQSPGGFALDLPGDSALLPYVVAQVLPHHYANFRRYDRAGITLRSSHLVTSAVARLMLFLPDAQPLRHVVHDDSARPAVHGAAMIALLLHPHYDISLREANETLLAAFNPEQVWFVEVIVAFLAISTSAENASARELVGSLLSRVSIDSEARVVLDGLLRSWREHSTSPVQGVDARQRWLAGHG
jgi:hypothetical protein